MFYKTDSQEYSVEQFLDKFRHCIPLLVLVTGQHGDTKYNEQVVRIHGVQSQARVLAKVLDDPDNCYGLEGITLSFPLSYDIHFCTVKRIKLFQKSKLLLDIVQQQSLPVEVKLGKTQSCCLEGKTIQLSSNMRLILQEEYTEHYMYGNFVNEGQLFRNIVSLTTQMKCLSLSLVLGLESENMDFWQGLLDSMTHTVEKYVCFDGKILNNEIYIASASIPEKKEEEIEKIITSPETVYESTDKTDNEHIYDEITGQITRDSHVSVNKNGVPRPIASKHSDKEKHCDVIQNKTDSLNTARSADCLDTTQKENSEDSNYMNIRETNNKNRLEIGKLTIKEVGNYLNLLNLGHFEQQFSIAQIDGLLLKELDEKILVDEFNFKRFEAIKLLKFARHGHLPKT